MPLVGRLQTEAPNPSHLLRPRRRPHRRGVPAPLRREPHARVAPQLHRRRPRALQERQRRPPPHPLRARRPQGRLRHRSHRVRPPHHLRLGRDHPPPRRQDLLQARVPGRRHAHHHEARLDPVGAARMAAGALLQAPQCAPNVRWPVAESQKGTDAIAGGRRGFPERLCCFVAEGDPDGHRSARQSAYGTSIVMPSLATTVSLNTSRASFTSSSALIEYRAETCDSTRRRALAASATCAASRAVECPVSLARSFSSSPNVASWTSKPAPSPPPPTAARAGVSPVNTPPRPGRFAPTIPSALTVRPSASATVSPFCNFPHKGPSGTPASRAFSGSNRPGRSCSLSA